MCTFGDKTREEHGEGQEYGNVEENTTEEEGLGPGVQRGGLRWGTGVGRGPGQRGVWAAPVPGAGGITTGHSSVSRKSTVAAVGEDVGVAERGSRYLTKMHLTCPVNTGHR